MICGSSRGVTRRDLRPERARVRPIHKGRFSISASVLLSLEARSSRRGVRICRLGAFHRPREFPTHAFAQWRSEKAFLFYEMCIGCRVPTVYIYGIRPYLTGKRNKKIYGRTRTEKEKNYRIRRSISWRKFASIFTES